MTAGLYHKPRHIALETCLRTINMVDIWQYIVDKYVLFDDKTMSNSFLCPHCLAYSLEHRDVNKWSLKVAELFSQNTMIIKQSQDSGYKFGQSAV